MSVEEDDEAEWERSLADLRGLPRVRADRILLRGPLEKRGTEECSFCQLENHDEVFVLWARHSLTGDGVGKLVGRSGSMWRMHLERHVPDWRRSAAEARVVYGGESDRLRERVLDEMSRSKDPLDREHLLEMSILTMRAYLAASLESTDPSMMSGLERMLGRLSQLTRQLEELRRERDEHAAKLEQMTEAEARRELEVFKTELREVLLRHPEVYKEVLDRHDAWRRERVELDLVDDGGVEG